MDVELLDVVKLKDGTMGTIVEVFSDAYMLEISDAKGHTLETPIITQSDIIDIIWHNYNH